MNPHSTTNVVECFQRINYIIFNPVRGWVCAMFALPWVSPMAIHIEALWAWSIAAATSSFCSKANSSARLALANGHEIENLLYFADRFSYSLYRFLFSDQFTNFEQVRTAAAANQS